MCRNAFRLIAVVFAFAALVAVAQPAQACYYQCEFVAPFCKQCVFTGTLTNALCEQVGPCGCRYKDVFCFAGASTEPELPSFLEAEPLFTPLQPALDGAPQPAALEPVAVVAAAD